MLVNYMVPGVAAAAGGRSRRGEHVFIWVRRGCLWREAVSVMKLYTPRFHPSSLQAFPALCTQVVRILPAPPSLSVLALSFLSLYFLFWLNN